MAINSSGQILYSVIQGKTIPFNQFKAEIEYNPGLLKYLGASLHIARLNQKIECLAEKFTQYKALLAEVNMKIPQNERSELDEIIDNTPDQEELTKQIEQTQAALLHANSTIIDELISKNEAYNKAIESFINEQNFVNPQSFATFSRDEILEQINKLSINESMLSGLLGGIKFDQYSTSELYFFLCQLSPNALPKTNNEVKVMLDKAKSIASNMPTIIPHEKTTLRMPLEQTKINMLNESFDKSIDALGHLNEYYGGNNANASENNLLPTGPESTTTLDI